MFVHAGHSEEASIIQTIITYKTHHLCLPGASPRTLHYSHSSVLILPPKSHPLSPVTVATAAIFTILSKNKNKK